MALTDKDHRVDNCFQRILKTEHGKEIPRHKELPAITETAAIVQIVVPSETVRDKIKLIFDDLCEENMQTKAREIRSLITRKHLTWFSQYIVEEWVEQGIYFHGLYLSFLECLDSAVLYSMVLMDTMKKARIILRRNQQNPKKLDQCRIRYLGHWLGVLNLAKNLRIQEAYIDLKDIIPETHKNSSEEHYTRIEICSQLPKSEPPATTLTEAEVQIIVPPETAQGKIAYAINSLCKGNVKIKAIEIKNIITRKYLPWFSRYLLTDRVPYEISYHDLYSNLLDCLDSKMLNHLIIMDTVQKVRVILERNAGIPSSLDKRLIKNLGHWLGMRTLAKNQPIPKEVIDFEKLLTNAYNAGNEYQLLVVQLVSKVFESRSGENFGEKNPWTMSIMSCLFKLFKKPQMNLQVLLEIQKLSNLLNIEHDFS